MTDSPSPSKLPPPPPLRRSAPASRPETPELGWKGKMKARGAIWGKAAVDKSIVISDNLGGKVNSIAEKRFGTHAFWPVTGDFGREMDKCAQILREFTVDGIVTTEKKTKRKVIRKIPPSVIANAQGLAIFTSMRSGIAPLGGAGGSGVVVARMPDGSWSPPASISPNNLSAGFLLGIDVYDCVLVIRTQKALDSFGGHKVTIGSEIGVAAGPYGVGAAVEAGKERAPVLSYVKSRGLYAGLEVVGQVFVSRFEENALMYSYPNVEAKTILEGKVRMPHEAADLMKALDEASSGIAQSKKGEPLDVPIEPGVVAALDLEDGEVLKLPPTPEMTDGHECEDDSETERVVRRSQPPALPPRHAHTQSVPPPLPPRHPARPDSARVSLDLIEMEASQSEPTSPTVAKKEALGEVPALPPRSKDRPASVAVFPAPDSIPSDLPPAYVPEAEMNALAVDDSLTVPEVGSPSSSYGSTFASPRTGPVVDDSPAIRHINPLDQTGRTPPAESPAIEIPPCVGADVAIAPVSALGLGMPEGEMSEGERKEWEQHLAEQKKEVRFV